jgi:DNA-binding FadR family transcriptional regulator
MASELSSQSDESVEGSARWSKPVHLPKASEIVANMIRREIVRGNIREGDFLPTEAKLIEQFGVSRPTLREALRVLEAEMLIVLHKGTRGGARVRGPQLAVAARYGGSLLQRKGTALKDVLAAQHLLETGAVRELADHASDDAVAALRAALAEEEKALDDLARFADCAVRFHDRLIAATGNQAFMLLAGILYEMVERHVQVVASREPPTLERPRWRTRSHEVHCEVINLIVDGDGDAAESLWRKHLTVSQRVMSQQIDITDVLELFD